MTTICKTTEQEAMALEKSFLGSPASVEWKEFDAFFQKKKPRVVRVRECSDLRNWLEEKTCDESCVPALENAG